MTQNKTTTMAAGLLSLVLMSACSNGNNASGSSVATQALQSQSLQQLSDLSSAVAIRPDSILAEFTDVENVLLLQLDPVPLGAPNCPPNAMCVTPPPPPPETVVDIYGLGSLALPMATPAVFSGFHISANFNEKINGGSACYQTALQAKNDHRGLSINGIGVLLPLIGATSGSGGATASPELAASVSDGTALLTGGGTMPPVFKFEEAVVVYASISSCEELPIIDPPPPIEPPTPAPVAAN